MGDTKTFEAPRLVEAAAFQLFGAVQTLERWRLIAHIIVFASAITSQFATGYLLYVTAIVALLAGLAAFIFRLIANRRNTLGHSLYRIAVLAKAYRMGEDSFDASYLLSKLPPRLHHAAIQAAASPDPSGEYNSPTDILGAEQLRWMIQENAFFNAALYDLCANQASNRLLSTGLLVGICMLLIIPMADGELTGAENFLKPSIVGLIVRTL